MKTEFHKFIHPELAERLLERYRRVADVVSVLQELIAGEHFNATMPVAKVLIERSEEFVKDLADLYEKATSELDASKAKMALMEAEMMSALKAKEAEIEAPVLVADPSPST